MMSRGTLGIGERFLSHDMQPYYAWDIFLPVKVAFQSIFDVVF
jgi:hypothetical protein